MTEEDIVQELRKEFYATVDVKNSQSILNWFDTYQFLSIRDFARIADKGPRVVRAWRKSAGIRVVDRPVPKCPRLPVRDYSHLEPVNNDAWCKLAYEVHGLSMHVIAKVLNRSVCTIYDRLVRAGTKIRPVKGSKNPYCTEAWLTEHYVKQELTVTECAKLAGVSRLTIYDWLASMNIQTRGNKLGSPIMGKGNGKQISTCANSEQRADNS